jgi:hypothetical protein
VEKAIKEMKDKKATGNYYVPEDVLLGENGLRLMTHLINIYETGKWLKHFTEITMTVSKKQPKATKCSDHYTISLNAHMAKTVAGYFRRTEMKIEDILGKQQL